MDFFEILCTEFSASSKPSSTDKNRIKCLIQECNNVAKVQVESRSCDQGCRKIDAFTLSATLPTILERDAKIGL